MHDLLAIRVYFDSNVLFSASLKPHSEFLDIWNLSQVTPVTSQYAVGEVSRNLASTAHRHRFESLLARTQFVSDADLRFLPSAISLVANDRPILAAAIFSSIEYLVTGDKNHFGHLYSTTISNVTILRPTEFLLLHKDRLKPNPLA